MLLRRSPLIVLLSLELMLNGANLALIAFARHAGNLDGQIFALAVMAVAASEVVVGLGLIVAMARKKLTLDVDKLSILPRMIVRRLDLPVRAARRRVRDHPRRHADRPPHGRLHRDRLDDDRVRRRRRRLRRRARQEPGPRSQLSTACTWLQAGSYHSGFSILVDQLSVLMMLIVTGVGSLIVAYSIGYMEGDDEERRYFAYMALFVFSMLLLVEGGNLILLLAGWGMVGLSSYLLIGFYHRNGERGRGREEGLRDERGRRRDDGDRLLPADQVHGLALVLGARPGAGGEPLGRQPRRARAARRRRRQVGAAAAPHLASRRDGGPDPGQRPDPRGDDGHRGRLPDRPLQRRPSRRRRTSRTSPPRSAPSPW